MISTHREMIYLEIISYKNTLKNDWQEELVHFFVLFIFNEHKTITNKNNFITDFSELIMPKTIDVIIYQQ